MSAAPPFGLSTATDVELLARVAERDRAAFVELVGRYAGRVKAFVLRAGVGPQDADEIAQDVMVLIWRHAASYDSGRAAPATWIYTIARNRRIDRQRRTLRPTFDPADPLFQPEPERDGLEQITAAERESEVRDGIASLSPEQREVLMAAFYDGLSHGEIAEALGLPLGTVKSRIRLAFRHLRGVLGDRLAEELGE